MIVTVENGNKMISRDEMSHLEWEMERHKFSVVVRVLKLTYCKTVLRVD